MSRREKTEADGELAVNIEAAPIVILEQDWGEWRAGKVLRLDADTAATFAVEHVRHRAATDRERALAGIL